MTPDLAINRFFARYPAAAIAAYAALIVVFGAIIWLSLASLIEQRAALADSIGILERLEAHQQGPAAAAGATAAIPAGSPFLGGETITVAGATLLQRVAGAVTQNGGTVQSSQVDVQGTQAKDGFVTLLITCEMEQASLQTLLYDLEAGMPFLFVDQLVAQGPQPSAVAAESRMRILLAVTGQWKGAK
ncbi:MAG TPA: type II secretion system protein GspM [Pseudolabrys sp.]|nr:type II secretion system protein GspM [Pseudolabrys sp.]